MLLLESHVHIVIAQKRECNDKPDVFLSVQCQSLLKQHLTANTLAFIFLNIKSIFQWKLITLGITNKSILSFQVT